MHCIQSFDGFHGVIFLSEPSNVGMDRWKAQLVSQFYRSIVCETDAQPWASYDGFAPLASKKTKCATILLKIIEWQWPTFWPGLKPNPICSVYSTALLSKLSMFWLNRLSSSCSLRFWKGDAGRKFILESLKLIQTQEMNLIFYQVLGSSILGHLPLAKGS